LCPANTDSDGWPDFLDNDSDNDGLSDREETTVYFTDPLRTDSDGDGYDDLAEAATHHNPLDANDRLSPDDYYVVLPYRGAPEERDLDFDSRVRKADVFFMMDRTGSMTQEADQLRTGIGSLVTQIRSSISDVAIGFGGFADFPVECSRCCVANPIGGGQICSPYGTDGDVPFNLYSTVSTDPKISLRPWAACAPTWVAPTGPRAARRCIRQRQVPASPRGSRLKRASLRSMTRAFLWATRVSAWGRSPSSS